MPLVVSLVTLPAKQAGPVSITTPHLMVPFTLDSTGAAKVVQQDSLADITQCVAQLLGTVVGSREVVPGYGITDPTFIGLDPSSIVDAVATWEPRAAVTVAVSSPPTDPAVVTVTVEQATP